MIPTPPSAMARPASRVCALGRTRFTPAPSIRASNAAGPQRIAGLLAPPYQALYCASKFAVVGMTEALRYEHEYRGIAFSTVCPGNVATPIFGPLEPPKDAISAEEAAQIILAGVEQKEGLIIFPESVKQMYLALRADQEKIDVVMKEMAETRRKAYATGGKYY